jgi:hypothetical protein
MPRLIPVCSAIVILCIATAPAQAAEPWQFRIAPYVWAASLEGDVATFSGVPAASVDASFTDILENLSAAFMIAGEAHNARFGFFGDILYVDVEATGSVPGPLYSSARLESQTLFATAAGFWRLWSDERASLDVMAGARFWSVDTKLALGAGILAATSVSHDEDWIDPLIGLKARGTLGGGRFFQSINVLFGGFDVGSDLMWDVNVNLGYQWTDGFSTSIGYRYLAVDYSNDGFLYDVVQQGPILALIWHF